MTITTATVKPKQKHYVNNEHFLEEMVVFRAGVKEAEATNGGKLHIQRRYGIGWY